MQSNVFKIDYQTNTLKRERISSELVNHNFLIKLSENQILNKINNFSSNVDVLVELGSNTDIGEKFSKSRGCFFVTLENSLNFLRKNSSLKNNIVVNENNLPFKQKSISGVISCLYVDSTFNSENLFSNIYNILKNNGFLIFSIFGTKTLENVKECFIKVEEKK